MLYCFMHVYIYSSLSFELNSISCNSLWNPPNVLLTFISLSTKHYNAHRKTRRRTVSWRLLRSQETRGRFHKQLQVFCTITLIPYKCATIFLICPFLFLHVHFPWILQIIHFLHKLFIPSNKSLWRNPPIQIWFMKTLLPTFSPYFKDNMLIHNIAPCILVNHVI
jgi:hypothetical protein